MPVSPIARCGVRARISSTGTTPGTTSEGGSTQAGRRYSTSDGSSGSSGGSDVVITLLDRSAAVLFVGHVVAP